MSLTGGVHVENMPLFVFQIFYQIKIQSVKELNTH